MKRIAFFILTTSFLSLGFERDVFLNKTKFSMSKESLKPLSKVDINFDGKRDTIYSLKKSDSIEVRLKKHLERNDAGVISFLGSGARLKKIMSLKISDSYGVLLVFLNKGLLKDAERTSSRSLYLINYDLLNFKIISSLEVKSIETFLENIWSSKQKVHRSIRLRRSRFKKNLFLDLNSNGFNRVLSWNDSLKNWN